MVTDAELFRRPDIVQGSKWNRSAGLLPARAAGDEGRDLAATRPLKLLTEKEAARLASSVAVMSRASNGTHSSAFPPSLRVFRVPRRKLVRSRLGWVVVCLPSACGTLQKLGAFDRKPSQHEFYVLRGRRKLWGGGCQAAPAVRPVHLGLGPIG